MIAAATTAVSFRRFQGLIRFKLRSGQVWTRMWPGDRPPPWSAKSWFDGSTWRDDFSGYWRPVLGKFGRQAVRWEWT